MEWSVVAEGRVTDMSQQWVDVKTVGEEVRSPEGVLLGVAQIGHEQVERQVADN
jgi:hypothetical protein